MQSRQALFRSIKKGNEKEVQALLRRGIPVNDKNEKGLTPLHTALLYEKVGIAKLLLRAGADGEILNPEGVPPLLIAASKNNLKLVQVLLQSRINPNARDSKKNTALMLAVAKRNPLIVKELLSRSRALKFAPAFKSKATARA